MPTDLPTRMPSSGHTVSRRFNQTRFAVRVGADWSPIRAAAIWPIADVLAAAPGMEAAASAPSSSADARVVLDLIDSGMIAPPRRRRRRERAVSSRAVFYQAAEA